MNDTIKTTGLQLSARGSPSPASLKLSLGPGRAFPRPRTGPGPGQGRGDADKSVGPRPAAGTGPTWRRPNRAAAAIHLKVTAEGLPATSLPFPGGRGLDEGHAGRQTKAAGNGDRGRARSEAAPGAERQGGVDGWAAGCMRNTACLKATGLPAPARRHEAPAEGRLVVRQFR